jgi:hypothetical protein
MRSTFFLCALVILAPQRNIFTAEKLSVRVVSSSPDMITGGDALVEIAGPPSILSFKSLSVLVNGRDVRQNFRARPTGNTLLGRIEGLNAGKNVLEVRVGDKRQALIELKLSSRGTDLLRSAPDAVHLSDRTFRIGNCPGC